MNAVGEETSLEIPHVTPAMQDYLKAVYRTRDEAGTTTVQRLAAELGVSSPSVTNMVKRLTESGLVRHARYRGVELTDSGQHVVLEVVRHHRLLEQFLVEMLGYSWDEAHAEAERLEHHISEAMEARIDAALGFPTHDPHGDPIPSREGVVAETGNTRLLDLEPGQAAVIVRVSDRHPEQLRYLGGLGLYPGVTVAVLEKLPFDGPLRIRVGDAEHLIGPPLASSVRVNGSRTSCDSSPSPL